jgi:hypothetical protein
VHLLGRRRNRHQSGRTLAVDGLPQDRHRQPGRKRRQATDVHPGGTGGQHRGLPGKNHTSTVNKVDRYDSPQLVIHYQHTIIRTVEGQTPGINKGIRSIRC